MKKFIVKQEIELDLKLPSLWISRYGDAYVYHPTQGLSFCRYVRAVRPNCWIWLQSGLTMETFLNYNGDDADFVGYII
jgi:hypothetical protein